MEEQGNEGEDRLRRRGKRDKEDGGRRKRGEGERIKRTAEEGKEERKWRGRKKSYKMELNGIKEKKGQRGGKEEKRGR